MKQKAVEIGKADTTSNKFGIRDQYWKLIQESKRHLHQQHALFLQVILNLGILEN
jgi:D-alanine transfer protein